METGITRGALAPPAAAGATGQIRPPDADHASTPKPVAKGDQVELSPEALALIAKLKARDTEVRQHEQAHLSAAGGLAVSGASFTYQRGPNGVSYAIGGEVQIDTSPGGTPQETIERARTIVAAALAPAEPSGADLAVAARAQQLALQAQGELAREQAASAVEEKARPDQHSRRDTALRRAYGVDESTAHTVDTKA